VDADELRRLHVKNLRVCLDNDDSIDPNDCVAAIETIDLLQTELDRYRANDLSRGEKL